MSAAVLHRDAGGPPRGVEGAGPGVAVPDAVEMAAPDADGVAVPDAVGVPDAAGVPRQVVEVTAPQVVEVDLLAEDAVESGAVEAETASSRLDGLVREALGGDLRARDRLLAEIHPFVLRYCRGRLGRQETVAASAEDVAQEVCLAVVSALPAYTLKGLSFRAFVYGIAAHKVTDAFRAIGRSRTDPVPDLPDSPASDIGPELRVLAHELSGRLERLLSVLTPRQRDVLVLRIMVGLSAEETAAVVSSTPGAVRVTQHRALTRLRAVLQDAGAGPGDDGAPAAP